MVNRIGLALLVGLGLVIGIVPPALMAEEAVVIDPPAVLPSLTPVPPTLSSMIATPFPFQIYLPLVLSSDAKPFGPFDFPPSEAEDWPFTASRLGRGASDLAAARAAGLGVLVALTGSRSNYTAANGCFSLSMWRAALDGNDLAAIQPYVDDGTILGLYALDEPFRWANDCGPTYVELNEVCRYANQRLPGISCGVNAPPGWLAQGLGETSYDQFGYLFTQTNFQHTHDWSAWAQQQLADAQWFNGPLWLSINVSTANPTLAQIRDAGVTLCQTDAAGVLMWKWPVGFGRPEAYQAMAAIARACGW